MDSETSIGPFVLKCGRIYNYTQLIALLKMKQKKYSAFSVKNANTRFADVLGHSTETFDAESVVEGNLHEKLKQHLRDYRTKTLDGFDKFLAKSVLKIQKEEELEIYSANIGKIADIENSFFVAPTRAAFRDDLLYDMYEFLSKRLEPCDFLQASYLSFIKAFMNLQTPLAVNFESEDSRSIESLVEAFVKLRFNQEEFLIEAYEGRYLWAEAFVLLRIGRADLLKQLLNKYERFFELQGHKFKTHFLDYSCGRRVGDVAGLGSTEDRFKRFLFLLVGGKAKADGAVIGSIEDYLWMKMQRRPSSQKESIKDFSGVENPRMLFMALLLTKRYSKAIDVLLRSDFSVIAKFFLLRELCLEQGLDVADDLQGQTRKAKGGICLADVNPIFLNFMFTIAARMSTSENCVKLIEMLKHFPDYHKVVAHYIIKHNLFKILGRASNQESPTEFYLDEGVVEEVFGLLRGTRNKRKLIQLHRLLPGDTVAALLAEVLEEMILAEEHIEEVLVEECLSVVKTNNAAKLQNLYLFYQFGKNPSISLLYKTAISERGDNLMDFRFVIEKLLPKAVEVVKEQEDRELAKHLFRLCGVLGLSEECCTKVATDLVMLL